MVSAAAIGERAEEVERVGVAHRHDEQRAVLAVEPSSISVTSDSRAPRPVAADHALGLAGRARGVHQRPRIARRDTRCSGSPSLARRDQVLVGAVAGRAGAAAEVDEVAAGTGRSARISSTTPSSSSCDDQRRGLGVLDDEADLGPDQAEIDRHGDQPGLGGRGVDLQPTRRSCRRARRPGRPWRGPGPSSALASRQDALVPLPEAHGALEVARACPVAVQTRVDREHLAQRQQFSNLHPPWRSRFRAALAGYSTGVGSSSSRSMPLPPTPASARMVCSISAATSGWSRRNCLAFSRPWPMRCDL